MYAQLLLFRSTRRALSESLESRLVARDSSIATFHCVDLVTSGSVDYRQRDVHGNIVATLEDLYGAANEARGRFEFLLQSMATVLSLSPVVL